MTLVQRLERDFLAGVQRNISTRVGAEFLTNLKMIFWSSYTRTQRAGELYEEEIFSRIADGKGHAARWMEDLLIEPHGEGEDFSLAAHNWRRAAKVPMLILNATTLNTGHNWQFTASWMGEPPAGSDAEVDRNDRLRRLYYREAPPPHNRIRVGHAVAASACVPGIFEPLVFDNLYPDITVRLVDGGAYDNQGVSSLLEQGCTVCLVSDGSGQTHTQARPSDSVLGVPIRAATILQKRLRESQFRELAARRRASLLRGLLFVHLKKDLDAGPIDWQSSLEAEAMPVQAARPPSLQAEGLTRYGIRKAMQTRLAAIRTHLDSFSDVEAYALMASGYAMTGSEAATALSDFPQSDGKQAEWRFLSLEKPLQQEAGSERLLELLDVGRKQAFRLWHLVHPLRITSMVLGALLLIGLLAASWYWADLPLLTLGTIGRSVAIFLLTLVIGRTAMIVVNYQATLTKIGVGIGMSLAGFMIARLHLHVFDRWLLRLGCLDQVIAERHLSKAPVTK